LTHSEIGIVISASSNAGELIARAKGRRRLRKIQGDLELPEIMIGEPKHINLEDNVLIAENSTLSGTPVSCGRVRAKVCVALNVEDAKSIKNGDILITRSTDIAWSVYFPLLSGVITELGGLLSHGAVVAREYGLPCLVNVKGATQHFQSGDEVILDADKGIISRVGAN